jgi:hypothetical protein
MVTAAGRPGSTTVVVRRVGLAFAAMTPTTAAIAMISPAMASVDRRRVDVAVQRCRNPTEPVVTTSTARSSGRLTPPMIVA